MTSKERFQLVLESDVSLATITRWDRGKAVNQAIDEKLTKAAKKLGLLEKRAANAG